ncbi:11653_t:CDS:2 [Diversispora eburnea]|uniref:11653_t:CDS:1 n=1 Tax=Diversispora eburnea TaxID=1213867 RepID=A0A9N9F4D8_9GLOM|nr:11653_t:CDS:2 [Diversispora eburnea]
MRIYIKTLKGYPFSLEIEKNDTVLCVKQSIEELQGISPEAQKLFFFNESLEDNNLISNYNIYPEATLHLKFIFYNNIQIKVQFEFCKPPFKKIVKYEIDPTSTTKMYNESSLHLFYFDKKLEYNYSLNHYKIVDESTLDCSISFTIFVKILQKIHGFQVFPRTKIIEIKKMIDQKEAIPPIAMRVSYNGEKLMENNTLRYYHIQNVFTWKYLIENIDFGYRFWIMFGEKKDVKKK